MLQRDDLIHRVGDRWILARWCERHHHWWTSNLERRYEYWRIAYAPTLEGLARSGGARTYSRRSSAVRRLASGGWGEFTDYEEVS